MADLREAAEAIKKVDDRLSDADTGRVHRWFVVPIVVSAGALLYLILIGYRAYSIIEKKPIREVFDTCWPGALAAGLVACGTAYLCWELWVLKRRVMGASLSRLRIGMDLEAGIAEVTAVIEQLL